jgi:hypothetical protein
MSAPDEEPPYEKYKKRGNDFHAAKSYKDAIKQYTKALDCASNDVVCDACDNGWSVAPSSGDASRYLPLF